LVKAKAEEKAIMNCCQGRDPETSSDDFSMIVFLMIRMFYCQQQAAARVEACSYNKFGE